jgi:hypothetical protein
MFFSLMPKKRTKRKAPYNLIRLRRIPLAPLLFAAASKTRPAFKKLNGVAQTVCRLISAKIPGARLRCNGVEPEFLFNFAHEASGLS